MAIANVLGIASYARVAAFLVPVAGALAFGAFLYGREWEQGVVAQRELDQQQQQAEVERSEAQRLRRVSERLGRELEHLRTAERLSVRELDAYLADRSDLVDCGLDADGLSLWNSWRLPPGATATSERDAAVPGESAERARWFAPNTGKEPP